MNQTWLILLYGAIFDDGGHVVVEGEVRQRVGLHRADGVAIDADGAIGGGGSEAVDVGVELDGDEPVDGRRCGVVAPGGEAEGAAVAHVRHRRRVAGEEEGHPVAPSAAEGEARGEAGHLAAGVLVPQLHRRRVLHSAHGAAARQVFARGELDPSVDAGDRRRRAALEGDVLGRVAEGGVVE